MLVRSIDIGEVFCARVGRNRARNGCSSRSRTRNVLSCSQLAPVRQLEVVEEVDDLLERGVRGQVADLVADVPQAPVLPVDVRDLRLGGDDVAHALVGHGARIAAVPVDGPHARTAHDRWVRWVAWRTASR